jgi:hypothetical protein
MRAFDQAYLLNVIASLHAEIAAQLAASKQKDAQIVELQARVSKTAKAKEPKK